MEVDDGVDAAAGEQTDVGRDLVQIGLVVVTRAGLDARPRQQQPGAVPPDGGHAIGVPRGERERRGEERPTPVVHFGVDVHAAKQHLST